jgi:hypothetical protein
MRWLGFAAASVIASIGCNTGRALDVADAALGATAAASPPAASPDVTAPHPAADAEAATPEVPDAGTAPAAARVPYRATAIALGGYHACALLDDGHVKCWGDNGWGELGLGDRTRRNDPSTLGDALPTVDLGTGRRGVSIWAGPDTSCAALDDGSFKCWGSPAHTGGGASGGVHGALPGGMGDALPALALGAGRTIRQVAIGTYLAFGMLDDGAIVEWAFDPPAEVRSAPASPAVLALTPSGRSASALFADGTVLLLDPTGSPVNAEDVAIADTTIRAIGGNESTLCIGPATGGLRCGGFGGFAAGPAVPSTESYPAIATTDIPRQIACGLRDDSQVVCLGDTASAWWASATQLAGESGTVVALGQPAKAIASGLGDLCALLADGSVKCWSASGGPAYGLPAIAIAGELRAGPWLPVDLGTRPAPSP